MTFFVVIVFVYINVVFFFLCLSYVFVESTQLNIF